MRPRTVLVTGGAGFLGVHLARAFSAAGARVRLLDLSAAPGWARDLGVEYVRGDVRDAALVRTALEGVDAVVHAAFASPHSTPETLRGVNVDGTRNVCAAALEQGIRRAVVISSTIVLKPPRAHPFLARSPLTRLDTYRSSRVEAEAVVAEHAARGLSAPLVRPKTLVGPERLGAFAIIFECIRLGRSVPVLGDGWNRYQLLDVRDMAHGIQFLAASDAAGLFSFGAREFRSVREDLQALLDHAGTGARLKFIPAPIARAALRAIELAALAPLSEWHYMSASGADSAVDISRAERELGWQPARSNAHALAEAYDWYISSLQATGAARTTHPVPLAHRTLKTFNWLFLR